MTTLSSDLKTIAETEISLAKLIFEFELGTLPKEEWTHRAHLLVALWYLSKFQRKEAIDKIRSGIINYNIASGGQNTDTSGYHETLTLFWVWVVGSVLQSYNGSINIGVIANKLLNIPIINSGLPFKYYSRKLLFSVEARKNWVEPDLRPPLSFPKE